MDPASPVRLEDLGDLVRSKRREQGLSLQTAALQSGVSPATLSRLERYQDRGIRAGHTVPDTRTLAAVTAWLGIPLEQVVGAGSPDTGAGRSLAGSGTTPDVVAAHLRADPKLDTQTAAALSKVFRAAYDQFLQLRSVPIEDEEKPSQSSSKGVVS